MEQADHKFDFSNKKLVKNTFYNLMGYSVPLIFAFFFIPLLISGLGKERFGLLSLSWVMIGYFSFFDFGIGKSVTKVISEKIGNRESQDIPKIFWNSLSFLFWISVVVMILGFFFVPSLVQKFIQIRPENYKESLETFYLIVVSIPLVASTTSVRGLLEAYQRFDVVNFYRIILGVSTFVVPYFVFLIVNSLFWIVFSLLFIRLLVWFMYLKGALKTNSKLSENFSFLFKFKTLKPVLKISVWITIVNVVGPVILYSDRFLISSLLSLTDVTFYSTPYEMITKLLILPTAFVGVLFPAFSASYVSDPELAGNLFRRAAKFVFLIVFPVVFLITVFSFEGLYVWLDTEFAEKSVLVLQFLSIGIMFSSLSSIPNNFFQGIGKPNIPAVLNMIELPIYLLFMYLFIKWYGIIGAAFFWMLAAGLDAIINYLIVYKKFRIKLESNLLIAIIISTLTVYILPFYLKNFMSKSLLSISVVTIFIITTWKFLIKESEKVFLLERISKLRLRR